MNPLIPYAGWRAAALASSFLHEPRENGPPERFLHLVWQHQRLRADALQLTDGRRVRVLHPGFWNRGAGPDFHGAVVRVADEPAWTGDVEIDLRPCDWRAHQHHQNPRYTRVILHVVWQDGGGGPSLLPQLTLAEALDGSLNSLLEWIDLDPGLPDNVVGRCASRLRQASREWLLDFLQQAAVFRFLRKSAELAARAREAGWEQALWEGLGAALGYEHNTWPMRRLVERRESLLGGATPEKPLVLEARLLGCSGLLPHEPARVADGTSDHLHQLWAVWWRERHGLEDSTLPRTVWRLGGVRPANHPQRRLALLAHWLGQPGLVRRLEAWFNTQEPPARQLASLLALLQAEQDPFWSWHWTLTSRAMARARPLLGASRITDLAVNVVLPWFHARASAGGGGGVEQRAVQRFLEWPAAQDNAVLRLARLRLFAGGSPGFPWTAARQQGLLQVTRDFCGHSNALCDACVLPARLADLVQ